MIDAIISEISTECDSLKTVSGPVADGVLDRAGLPAAIVYPTADALGSEMGASTLLVSRIAVELIAETNAALETARAEIRAALSGFQPDGAVTPLRFGGGRLDKIDGARLIWVDAWECKTCL